MLGNLRTPWNTCRPLQAALRRSHLALRAHVHAVEHLPAALGGHPLDPPRRVEVEQRGVEARLDVKHLG